MLQPKTRQFRASLTLESLVTKLRIPSHKYANSVLEYLNWLKLFSYILCNRSKTKLHYNLLEIFVKQTNWDVEAATFSFLTFCLKANKENQMARGQIIVAVV